MGGVEQAAAAERDTAGSRAFEKIPACGHVVSSDFLFFSAETGDQFPADHFLIFSSEVVTAIRQKKGRPVRGRPSF
jgi:type IV secretory pathway protease TraF